MPRRLHPRATLGPLAATVAGLVLTACAGTAAQPEVAAMPTPLNVAGLRLPMQDYIPDAQQLLLLNRTQWILTDQCMSRYGFHDRLPQPPGATSGRGENDRRYGLYDPEAAAAASGYGAEEADEPRRPPLPSMDPMERLVLSGSGKADPKTLPTNQAEAERSAGDGEVNGLKVPIGGCTRESYLKLWMPTADSRDPMKVQDLDAEGYDRSRQDSRVVGATAAWSDCMARKGYHAKNPVSPQPELGLVPTTFASPAGITTATADVGCKREVNLVGIWYSVESAYQHRLIERNADLLRGTRKQQDDALRLAAQLIAKAG